MAGSDVVSVSFSSFRIRRLLSMTESLIACTWYQFFLWLAFIMHLKRCYLGGIWSKTSNPLLLIRITRKAVLLQKIWEDFRSAFAKVCTSWVFTEKFLVNHTVKTKTDRTCCTCWLESFWICNCTKSGISMAWHLLINLVWASRTKCRAQVYNDHSD